MRLRATAAALGAVGVLLSLPGSALAAEGDFAYSFQHEGQVFRTALHDPEGRVCHRLDLLDAVDASAYRVHNGTTETAVAFADADCASDAYFVLRAGETAPPGVLVRSVLFVD